MKRWAIVRSGVTVATVLHPEKPTSSAEIGIDIAGATVVEIVRVPDPRFENVSAANGVIAADMAKAATAFAAEVDAAFEGRMDVIAIPEMKQRMHRRKEAEARLFVASVEAETPMLTVEAAETGITVVDLADQVIAKADTAVATDADREAARRKAKIDIRAAATADAMRTIVSNFRNEVSQWST